MPNLHRMADKSGMILGAPHGREGTDIAASGPHYISFPGYKEMLSGQPDPTCDTNDCPAPTAPTLLDAIAASGSPEDVALVTSWPAIARAATSVEPAFLVSPGRRTIQNGAALAGDAQVSAIVAGTADASPLPGEGDYRPDALTASLALRVLEDVRPRFLFVGLGDADEHAHRGYYRGYLDALHASDAFLGQLEETLHRMGARGEHTTVIVTADHGRAFDFTDHGIQFPESARVWFAAAGADVRGRGSLTARKPYKLSNIAPTVRALLGMQVEERDVISEVTGLHRAK
jgi:uncharacterized protein (DUF1501 family)